VVKFLVSVLLLIVSFSFLMRTLIPSRRLHFHSLITSQRPHLLIVGFRVATYELQGGGGGGGRHKTCHP
jgi:hypothetical protein